MDALDRRIDFTDPSSGKQYALRPADELATIVVRPRGWHLPEKHLWVDGEPVSASLFDFGLYFFHCARDSWSVATGRTSICRSWSTTWRRGCGTTCSSPLRSGWGSPGAPPRHGADRDAAGGVSDGGDPVRAAGAFGRAERGPLGLSVQRHQDVPHPRRGVRAAGTERDHHDRPVHARLHRAAGAHLPQAGAHAIGGTAAFIPNRRDPEVNEQALAKVRSDKRREATDGFDGSWVAHPDWCRSAQKSSTRCWVRRPTSGTGCARMWR